MNLSAVRASVGAVLYAIVFLLLPYSIRRDAFLTFLYGGLGLAVSGVVLLTMFRNGMSASVEAASHVLKMIAVLSLFIAMMLYIKTAIHY